MTSKPISVSFNMAKIQEQAACKWLDPYIITRKMGPVTYGVYHPAKNNQTLLSCKSLKRVEGQTDSLTPRKGSACTESGQ